MGCDRLTGGETPPRETADPARAAGGSGDAAPFAGRTVLLVHPAWHSCGSHQVFVSQALAYRQLGARVLSLAVADSPGAVEGSRAHRAYAAATGDLQADLRLYTGMPLAAVARPSFLEAARLWLHGNFAAILAESARLAPIPAALAAERRIDLIHCNHYFCMPVASRLKQARGAPILLDTHDLQARQYALRNETGWTVPPRAEFDAMLAIELAELARADVLLHLNDEEAASFRILLPARRHELVYPAAPPVEAKGGGEDLIIVASANYANYLGVVWFLEEVLPRAPKVEVKIIGNIDGEFRRHAPGLLRRHAALFKGRVEDLGAAYAAAAAVLLPTTQGHGISIKTIEAMSSGAPLIATPHAFRGMQIDPARLANVTLATDPGRFAAALTRAATLRETRQDRRDAPTRRAYEQNFAPDAYRARLAALAAPLLP